MWYKLLIRKRSRRAAAYRSGLFTMAMTDSLAVEIMVVFWEWQDGEKRGKDTFRINTGRRPDSIFRLSFRLSNAPPYSKSLTRNHSFFRGPAFPRVAFQLFISKSTWRRVTLTCRWNHLHGRYWQFWCLVICNLDLPVDLSQRRHLVWSG